MNDRNKSCEFSGNTGDGINDSDFEIKDWMQGFKRSYQNSHKGLSLSSPVDGVSLIGFVRYLEHESWKRRMVR